MPAGRIAASAAAYAPSLGAVIVLYAVMQGLGLAFCVVGAVWAWRTRHQRLLWRKTRHDTARVAIVLELEEKVRALEEHSAETIDVR